MSASNTHAQKLIAAVLCLGLLGGCSGGADKETHTSTSPTTDIPVDLSGVWVSARDLVIGTLRIQQDGELVNGTVENEYGSQPLTGSVFGYDLAFSFAQVRSSCEVKVNCFATLFDEQMRGSCRLSSQCPDLPATTRNGRITLTRE